MKKKSAENPPLFVELCPEVREKLLAMQKRFGSKRRITHAAIWLFADAPPNEQIEALEAVGQFLELDDEPSEADEEGGPRIPDPRGRDKK